MAKRRTTVDVRLRGFEETAAAREMFGVEAGKELRAHRTRTAIRVQAAAVSSIQRGPKSGHVYSRRGVAHRASAPGQPPATDTGALASSVARVDEPNQSLVGTGLMYGRDLEFGTVNMAARPWLFPALEANREYYVSGMKKVLEKAARVAGGKVARTLSRMAKRFK